ncbi:ABC transporter permease [Trinickia caryophylli]|nr:ABC transporter permease [Trinickia caryophylli]WQE12529.1 ABC transporter permease [Trinickia caryophylli]GLU30214.1 transport permease protein [Trinickia caryophylli]
MLLSKLAPADMAGQILRHRAVILALAWRDLQSRYAGTLGGTLWAFAHPVAIITVFYFVFAVGFKSQAPGNAPFILWFVCGLVPWFYFNDTLLAMTNSITGNAHLVKKTVFPTEVLPVVHVVSGLFSHAIFLLILGAMLVSFHVPLQAGRLLIVYYLGCGIVLLLGLGWLFSSLQVFFRDIGQGLTIILNLWFWGTPIVWAQQIMPAKYHWVFFFNPVYYIVEGYRGLLIYPALQWPDVHQTMYFWAINCLIVAGGAYAFRRLKPEFVDVM